MDTTSLREAGLTEGEIKVYLALLKLGASTTGPIVDTSGVSRSIIPQILEKLIEKGLVSYIVQEKTKHYQAAEPNRLLEYIDEREEELQANKKKVEALLPTLLATSTGAPKAAATIYTGFKGVQTAHENMYAKMGKDDEYFYLGILAEQDEKYHLYWQRDHRRRIKIGFSCRLLFDQKTDKNVLKNRNSFKSCDARYMPIDLNTPAWFMGYKDTVVIGLQDENLAIEIVNQKIADSFKEYFEGFWDKSTKFKR